MSYVLESGRRMAESRMTDSCAVTRSGERVWDEGNGKWVDETVTVYTGRCRVKHPSASPRDADAGSQLLTVGQLEVHVPVGSPVFKPDDAIEITASETRSAQVGRKFAVLAPFDGSQTTAVRYRVEATDGRG